MWHGSGVRLKSFLSQFFLAIDYSCARTQNNQKTTILNPPARSSSSASHCDKPRRTTVTVPTGCPGVPTNRLLINPSLSFREQLHQLSFMHYMTHLYMLWSSHYAHVFLFFSSSYSYLSLLVFLSPPK